MPDLGGHSALPKEKLLQGRSSSSHHAWFQCSISLHSCTHLPLLTPFCLQKCLDSPLHYPAFPLIPCSLLTLLTLFFPSLVLSELPGLCCTDTEGCFEVLDFVGVDGEAFRGEGKELSWMEHRLWRERGSEE